MVGGREGGRTYIERHPEKPELHVLVGRELLHRQRRPVYVHLYGKVSTGGAKEAFLPLVANAWLGKWEGQEVRQIEMSCDLPYRD